MKKYIENTYWIAIAHLPRWQTDRINRLIIQVVHEKKMSWPDFFEMDQKGWGELFALGGKELSDLEEVRNDLPRLAFIAEQLQNEGFQLIPVNSPDYPVVLKDNLKIKNSPPVLYIKGRKGLLQEDAVAIVGSRNSGKTALEFTDRVARKSCKEHKVVVSGFAKGVDKQALDSTIDAKGKSIIVLPQGILTFQSGFKKYYEPVVSGDVLVLSTFFPQAGWDVGLAMARNAYIYGLAKEIYVAESEAKGGTWEGAINGLKRGRKIYVRIPEAEEKNANRKLIELGAVPVNMNGQTEDPDKIPAPEFLKQSSKNIVKPATEIQYDTDIEKEIFEVLKRGSYTLRELLIATKLDWDSRKLTSFLRKNPNVKTQPGKPAKYTLNDSLAPSLFKGLNFD